MRNPLPSQHSSRRLIKGFKKLLEFRAASEAINLEWNQVNNLILTALRLTIKINVLQMIDAMRHQNFHFFLLTRFTVFGGYVKCVLFLTPRRWNFEHLFSEKYLRCCLHQKFLLADSCSDYSLPKLLAQLSKSNKACISSTEYTDLKL